MKLDTSRADTDFLRSIAIILIVNSHLDAYYPRSGLATGGMLGNSLFFMLSAFGLAISWQKHSRPFSQWYGRRIQRILPPVWIFSLFWTVPVSIVRGTWVFDSRFDWLSIFFFPPDLWFIRALMVFYLLVFIILSRGSDIQFSLAAFALATGIVYIGVYAAHWDVNAFWIEQEAFKILFYFLVVLFGVKLATRSDQIAYRGPRDAIALITCLLLMYAHKFVMGTGRV